MERNIADIMTLGWTEEEIRAFDSAEQKELARTARRLQKQAQWQLDSVASGDGQSFNSSLRIPISFKVGMSLP